MQNDDDITITVPEHLKQFSQALRPCLKKVERTLASLSGNTRATVESIDEPSTILQRAQMAIGSIDQLIETMMIEVIDNPAVSVGEIHRHVGRFEGNLDLFLTACTQATVSDMHGYPEVRRLVVDGFRRILEQIQAWLRNICDTLDNPLQAYRNRPHTMENDTAVFSFDLTLKAPPEFKALQRYIESVNTPPQTSSKLGFWDTAGALVLGFALADWVFDDD